MRQLDEIEATLERGDLDDDAGQILHDARCLLEEVKRLQLITHSSPKRAAADGGSLGHNDLTSLLPALLRLRGRRALRDTRAARR